MYRIYADDVLIYNDSTPDSESTKLIGPSLSLKDNAAGSFEATIPLGNVCYDTIACFDTTIDIFRHNQDQTTDWVWSGRILKISKDFYNYKKITCEGVLAYLNDTVVPVGKIERYDLRQYVSFLLNMHNQKVEANRRIGLGAVSATNAKGMSIGFHDYEFDGDNVLSYLGTAIEDWGLHARIRYNQSSSPKFTLDLLTDTQLTMAHQSVNFGKNLLDFSSDYDWSEIVTAILPYGGEIDTNDESEDEEIPDRYSIEGLHPSSSRFVIDGKYLINRTAAQEHGRIEQTVEWSDVEDPQQLLSLAEAYLDDYNYATMTLNVTVLDLHYLMGSDYEPFDFLSQINCYSTPHNLHDTFIVKEMSIPFDNPENTTFSMSKETRGYYGSDRRVSGGGSSKLSATASHIPSRESVLRLARENAAAMINMATNGYITLVPTDKGDRTYALTITNGIDEDASTQMWKWTLGGLMFQDRSSISADWNLPAVAITMDGQIVATRITTGTLAVDDGHDGYLLLADMDTGTMQVAGFDYASTYFYHDKSSLSADNVDGIYIGLDGIAIGETNRGLFKVDISGQDSNLVKLLSGKTQVNDDNVNGFYLSSDGFALGATGNGLFKIVMDDQNGNLVRLLSGKSSLDDDDVDGFYLSYDGISIGQSNTGLFKVDTANNVAYIAGFNFDNSSLWTLNKNSIDANEPGFYIGTDGLSNNGSSTSITIRQGRLEGALDGVTSGYINTNVRHKVTNEPGLIVGGDGCVIISTDTLGVADYVGPTHSGDLPYHKGKDDSFDVVTGLSSSSTSITTYRYTWRPRSISGRMIDDCVWDSDSGQYKITGISQYYSFLHDDSDIQETTSSTTISFGTPTTKQMIFHKGLYTE